MRIPEIISIGSSEQAQKIPVFLLFIFVSIAVSWFVLWNESRKDGFDEERVYDLFFISLLSSFISSRLFYALEMISRGYSYLFAFYTVSHDWSKTYTVYGALVGLVAPLFLFTKFWKWSIYRILDIFSLVSLSGICVSLLGYILIYRNYKLLLFLLPFTLLYLVLAHFRLKIQSGYIFSITLILSSILGLVLFRSTKSLIFYVFLLTMSLANIFFRKSVDIMETNLPLKFLNYLKGKLVKKNTRLRAEQKLLVDEDPYLQGGRAIGNAEDIDEAILEDAPKELTEIKKSALSGMRTQVRRALGMINIGAYGICEICKKPIDKARLKAYPEATTCIDCENKKQRGQ